MRRNRRRQEIPAIELVRGDLVLLEAGDRISADLDGAVHVLVLAEGYRPVC